MELSLIGSAWHGTDLSVVDGTVSIELERTPEPERILELVEESYRETARILADLGVRDATAWQPVSST